MDPCCVKWHNCYLDYMVVKLICPADFRIVLTCVCYVSIQKRTIAADKKLIKKIPADFHDEEKVFMPKWHSYNLLNIVVKSLFLVGLKTTLNIKKVVKFFVPIMFASNVKYVKIYGCLRA